MIIVEGPDGAGKSNLVQYLLMTFPTKLGLGQRSTKNTDNLKDHVLMDHAHAFSYDRSRAEPDMVWDRLLFSELVYSPIVHDRPVMWPPDQVNAYKAHLQTFMTMVIFCLPPIEVVRANVKKTPQMDGVVENIDDIYDAYFGHFKWTPGAWMYDYTHGPEAKESIANGVRQYMKLRRSLPHVPQ